MSRLENKLIELGYKYVKRKNLWNKYKDYPIEIIIMYDIFDEKWDGWLSFNNFVISNIDSLNDCINITKTRYEELQKDLEVLKEYEKEKI